jgi:hypothetical protein
MRRTAGVSVASRTSALLDSLLAGGSSHTMLLLHTVVRTGRTESQGDTPAGTEIVPYRLPTTEAFSTSVLFG